MTDKLLLESTRGNAPHQPSGPPAVVALASCDTHFDLTFVGTRPQIAALVDKVKMLVGREWIREQRAWRVPTGAGLYRFLAVTTPEMGFDYAGPLPPPDSPTLYHDPVDRRFVLRSAFYRPLVDRIRSLSGSRWLPQIDAWGIPDHHDAAVADLAADFAERLLVSPRCAQRWGLVDTADAADIPNTPTCDDIDADNPDTDRFAFTLFPYQHTGAQFICDHKRVILGDQPGLGKTAQSIAAVTYAGGTPTVVVCPAGVRTNWQRELTKTLGEVRSHVLTSDNTDIGDADWIIVSYHGIADPKLSRHLPTQPAHLILDEAHYTANPTSQRSRAVTAYARQIPRGNIVAALTGTPIPNRTRNLGGVLSAIGRIHDIQPGGLKAFQNQYCGPKRIYVPHLQRTITTFDGATNTSELCDRLYSRGVLLRRTKQEVLHDLPPKLETATWFDLDRHADALYRRCERSVGKRLAAAERFDRTPDRSEQAEAARQLRRELYSVLAARKPSATIPASIAAQLDAALATGSHLQQVVGLRALNAACKLPNVLEHIRLSAEDGRKLIVFAHHRFVAQALSDRLHAPQLTGAAPLAERDQLIRAFQQERKPQVLICSIEAAGVGLTLTAASRAMFVELPWTPAALEQCGDRVHRIGQTEPVHIQYLLGVDTFDRAVLQLLLSKIAQIRDVLGGDEVVGGPAVDTAQYVAGLVAGRAS